MKKQQRVSKHLDKAKVDLYLQAKEEQLQTRMKKLMEREKRLKEDQELLEISQREWLN